MITFPKGTVLKRLQEDAWVRVLASRTDEPFGIRYYVTRTDGAGSNLDGHARWLMGRTITSYYRPTYIPESETA